jgi:hypothetical protein
MTASNPSLSLTPLTLLDYTLLLWIALCSLVLISPLFKLLRDAGTYGKLHATGATGKKQDDAAAVDEARRGWRALALHPALYVRTSVAFTSYYAFASIWNGWLLFEADIIWNSGFMTTPVISLIRAMAAWVSPTQGVELAAVPVLRKQDDFRTGLLLVQLLLFQAHVMRRLWESMAVAKFSSASSQHALVTALGQFLEWAFLFNFHQINLLSFPALFVSL